MPNIIKIFTYSLICFIPLISPLYARHSGHQLDVLAIHSYHQEYPWTSSQYEAFKTQFKDNLSEYSINFSSEYLDTKRIAPSTKYQQNFLYYLNAKYGNHRPDIIYVTDDNALNFIYSESSSLNWDVPVVFSGINNTNLNKSKAKYPLDGIFEYKDILSSIKLAKKITKKGAKIIFIGDGGVTDKAIRKIIINGHYNKNGIEVTHRSFTNINALISRLDSMEEGTVILTTIGRIRDNENNILKLRKTIKKITDTGRKVLVMEDSYLFEGVLGGYVTSGRVQGESAANIASEIVQGNKKGTTEAKSSSEFILSYPEIIRFNIDINEPLLRKAKIINLPLPFLERYPEISKWLLWLASILLIIIFGFILNTRRKNIQLKEQYTDSITGLPNRVKLINDINQSTTPSLTILDINNFKTINNLYGLNVGDNLLRDFGKKVKQHIGDEYPIYRLGGNQFAILSERGRLNEKPGESIKILLSNIQNSNYRIGNIDINITLTAGISRNEREFLIPRAEQALQKAKDSNKDYALFESTTEDTEQHRKNLLWAQKLNAALTDDRIIPYFQLITHNKTGKQDKYEALVRLIDEDGEIIPPFFFLETAKSTRQYATLTKVMIEKTFQTIGDQDISISINLTVEDIRDSKTIKFFKEKLNEYQVAKKVIVELTESEGIESYSEVATFIKEIKDLGCRVAIDDFGTGYSNFTHLIHLNVDYLKIDGSIIQNILKDKNAEIVAITLVDFAKQLGIETIAEFVDSEEILKKVTEIGIDYSQGFLLGKPQSTLSN